MRIIARLIVFASVSLGTSIVALPVQANVCYKVEVDPQGPGVSAGEYSCYCPQGLNLVDYQAGPNGIAIDVHPCR